MSLQDPIVHLLATHQVYMRRQRVRPEVIQPTLEIAWMYLRYAVVFVLESCLCDLKQVYAFVSLT